MPALSLPSLPIKIALPEAAPRPKNGDSSSSLTKDASFSDAMKNNDAQVVVMNGRNTSVDRPEPAKSPRSGSQSKDRISDNATDNSKDDSSDTPHSLLDSKDTAASLTKEKNSADLEQQKPALTETDNIYTVSEEGALVITVTQLLATMAATIQSGDNASATLDTKCPQDNSIKDAITPDNFILTPALTQELTPTFLSTTLSSHSANQMPSDALMSLNQQTAPSDVSTLQQLSIEQEITSHLTSSSTNTVVTPTLLPQSIGTNAASSLPENLIANDSSTPTDALLHELTPAPVAANVAIDSTVNTVIAPTGTIPKPVSIKNVPASSNKTVDEKNTLTTDAPIHDSLLIDDLLPTEAKEFKTQHVGDKENATISPLPLPTTSTPAMQTVIAQLHQNQAKGELPAVQDGIQNQISDRSLSDQTPAAMPLAPLQVNSLSTPATAAANNPSPHLNPMDRAVAQQVSRSLIQHLPSGDKMMVLRLTPPELGTVRIELIEHQGVLSARLHAEDDGVRHALEKALPFMRQELRASDAPIREVNVGDQSRFDQAPSDQQGRNAQGQSPNQRPRPNEPVFTVEGGSVPREIPAPISERKLGGQVDNLGVNALA